MNISTLLSLLALVSLSISQKDPLNDFCRLFGHQTTLVDRKLYIDGGLVNWAPLSAASPNYTSTWLKNGDLDKNNGGFPQEHVLEKAQSVPSVHGGTLWADEANKQVYLYGGEYGNGQPEDFKLWYYDIVYNTWNISNATTSDIRRASWGAGVAVQDRGQGYYYGGWLTDASVPGYQSQTALSNMLVYDMLANSFRNQSGPDQVPRAEGVMLYLPVGDAGMLVYFGGVQQPYGNDTTVAMPMNQILVYDIANAIWYNQEAAGDVPEDRRRFCAGATWAEDRSSYNIYLFGGASVGDGVGYGDVYILSLPSFTWIKFWPRPEDQAGASYPHHSLTCNVISGSQMIIMGGQFPNTTDCDVPTIYGQHGLDLGKANKKGSKWAEFDPKLTTYQVPEEIAQTIGGGPTGGATRLAPAGGFAQRDLSIQFTRPYTEGTRDPTRVVSTATATSSATPSAAPAKDVVKTGIIGGVVGGVGGFFLVAAATLYFLSRRKKARAAKSRGPPLEIPPQFIYGSKSPILTHGGSYHTPQDSPPPGSQRGWGDFRHHPRSPEELSTPMAQPEPRYHGGADSLYASPVNTNYDSKTPLVTPHELPSVMTPPPVRRSMMKLGLDPYFANHPPSPPARQF